MAKAAFLSVKSVVKSQRGTPQDQVDWSSPDEWILDRLTGADRTTARAIWEGSGKLLNPRHLTGHWALATRYELLHEREDGTLGLTDDGRRFVADPSGAVVQSIDGQEGLDRILGLVAELGPAGRVELLPPFSDFARKQSNLRADSSLKAFLWARLRNLLARGLVERAGRSYSATEAGLAWLSALEVESPVEVQQETDLLNLIRERRQLVRKEVAGRLSSMDPFDFEHLVKTLLEAMDYEDVRVTSRGGDGGVDVLAHIQLGITEVVEAVQVKRQAKNIQRHVLDALRGSLFRFGAVRGTIITTGGFASGTIAAAFEAGGAPITLIDGKRLIDLMFEHGIGVQKRRVDILEVDPSAFEGPAEDVADE